MVGGDGVADGSSDGVVGGGNDGEGVACGGSATCSSPATPSLLLPPPSPPATPLLPPATYPQLCRK